MLTSAPLPGSRRGTQWVLAATLCSCLLAPSFFAIANAQQRSQLRPQPQRSAVQDWSWYPYESVPPFFAVELGEPDTIHALSARFQIGREPVIPSELARRGDASRPGYWIVHFKDGVDARAKQLLDELTGPVQGPDGRTLARWYIPDQALIAFVENAAILDAIVESPLVDWTGPYHPAYKLCPSIGRAYLTSPDRMGRETYVLNVDLIPGHAVLDVVTQASALGAALLTEVYRPGLQTYDVHYLVLQAAPQVVTALAQIEGVRVIQEAGDGEAQYDLSGGGKLQNRSLAVDDKASSPIVTATDFPLWITHDLQGQGQLIGVVDSSIDWNNVGTTSCDFGSPDTLIDNWGFALPKLSRVLLPTVGTGGVNLKIPRADLLGGATLQGKPGGEHGQQVAGAALGDFYGDNDTKWWEHDVDDWESWAPSNYSGLLGPGIAHEAQLYFTPTNDDNGVFQWQTPGEFEMHMATTLGNMSTAGCSTTAHSTGIVEASNTYTAVSVTHDTAGFDYPLMLQCIAAGNDGAIVDALSSQAVVKNAMTVGASDDVLQPEDRVTFSSIGPTFDSRIKPDVMAPGDDTGARDGGVNSLLILPESNGTGSGSCAYRWTSGTSFAAPTISGAGALVHQYYEESNYVGNVAIVDPSSALMKATLINGAQRLTGANLGSGDYPNGYQGWGEPQLTSVLEFTGSARKLVAYDVDGTGGFGASTDPVHTYEITVHTTSEPLRVTLVWIDEPGTMGLGKKLINDLHLEVEAPDTTTYLGNDFDLTLGVSKTGGAADTDNTVENVFVPGPAVGTWTITVDPSVGNYSVNQGYALVITGDVSEDDLVITQEPLPAAVCLGDPATLSVMAVGTAPIAYQWSKDGTVIGGETASSLTISSVSSGDAGSYTVEVSNPCCTVTSQAAVISVLIAPSITTQPGNDTVCVGGSTMLSVTATGSGPLSYQWYQDGSLLGGATSSSLMIDPVDAADAGVYTVDVTNVCGTATSAGATLTVLTAPSITTQPGNDTVCVGGSTTLSVTATGSAPLSYQWYQDGSLLGGATSSSLMIDPVDAADAGVYTVDVTNVCGTATS
ncbi:MAG: immunoglobulin domain-containing protein, partial [Planctomycetota bacterium]